MRGQVHCTGCYDDLIDLQNAVFCVNQKNGGKHTTKTLRKHVRFCLSWEFHWQPDFIYLDTSCRQARLREVPNDLEFESTLTSPD